MQKVILSMLALALLTSTYLFISTTHKRMPSMDMSMMDSMNMSMPINSEIPSSTSITPQIKNLFNEWKTKHQKFYPSPLQESYRLSVFAQNLDFINNFKNPDYQVGANQFMDLTHEEFVKQYLTLIVQPQSSDEVHMDDNVEAIANTVNWVQKGKVTEVKNQGNCGGCWAFSATGAMESLRAIKGINLGLFSEQQLIDCSRNMGNQGCNGGLMDIAYRYVMRNGITSSNKYPYTGRDGKCRKFTVDYKIRSYTNVPAGNCNSLLNAVNLQPISIAVDATNWQFYKSGVFSNCQANLNHGILLVGYDRNKNYYVKNSWGTSWGMQGYGYLRGGRDTCGICQAASYPNV